MRDKRTGYGQYCPIARAVEVLGERWSLLILRDMLVGATRFNELTRGQPGLSRSLLSKRLRQLEQAGIIEHVDDEYRLTDAGHDLQPIVFGLGEWGAKWTFGDPDASELDPELLVWWMHTRLDTNALPDRRIVLQVRFRDDPRRFWLLIEAGTPSVCLTDPGFEIDVTIDSDLPSLYKVWLGKLSIEDAMRSGTISFGGRSALTRCMPEVLRLSPISDIVSSVGNRP